MSLKQGRNSIQKLASWFKIAQLAEGRVCVGVYKKGGNYEQNQAGTATNSLKINAKSRYKIPILNKQEKQKLEDLIEV